MMAEKHTLREMLTAGEFVWAPCVYDCVSARIAELCGYNAILLSSCEMEFAMNGVPAGMMNWEEFIWATERIARSTPLPLIVDGDNCGGSPMQVYRNCRRLALAGAAAISVEDSLGGGINCGYHYASGDGLLSAERWAANVKAAVEAVKGTDCMIIARTECLSGGAEETGAYACDTGYGLEEAIRRANLGHDAGAEITMIQNICHAGCEAQCREIAKNVPGWRFYPDIHASGNKSDVTMEELQEWGFHLVSNHAAMKGAMKGMMEYLLTNFRNKNSVYSENDEFYGMGHAFTPFRFDDWIRMDQEFTAYETALKGNCHGHSVP